MVTNWQSKQYEGFRCLVVSEIRAVYDRRMKNEDPRATRIIVVEWSNKHA